MSFVLRLLRTYMPMRAKRLGVSHGGRCVGCPAPCTQNRFLFLFLLPVVYLNIEQTIAGISTSILYRTVVANFNNLQTHPVCNLFSTNEINPSENIFNNNVTQNGISKIVKSWRLNQFLLKSGRLQPLHRRRGYNIRRYTPIQSGTEELLLSSRKVHPPVGRFGGKQDSLIGHLGGGLIRI